MSALRSARRETGAVGTSVKVAHKSLFPLRQNGTMVKRRLRGRNDMISRLLILLAFILFPQIACAEASCNPKDNTARILTGPSPNAIDPQWTGDSFVGTGWSFEVSKIVHGAAGLFAQGNLYGSRGGLAQKDVYILLSEWQCPESIMAQGPLPQTFWVRTEKGRRVKLIVTNFGRIVPSSKTFTGIKSQDSTRNDVRSYHLDYNIVLADRLPKEDGAVIGYEFLVPWIARGDRLILNRTTERPYQVAEGGTGNEHITAPWPFGHAESNSKRVLFIEFTGPQDTSHLGEWQTDLVVNGKVLVSRTFTLYDPSGRVDPSVEGREDTRSSSDALSDIVGVWAHSASDCRVANSGQLKTVSRFEATPYEIVGICRGGLEYLYEAVSCNSSNVNKTGDTIDVEASCRFKDYDPEAKHFHIHVQNSEALEFVDKDFAITGKYVRCAPTYACAQ